MSSDEKTQILGPPDPVAVGSQLSGTYELDKRIASGGMGEVYRGHNIQTGDPVAIKIVLPEFARDATILSLFRKEASILNHLFHEAIVRYHVFAIDQTIGRPYLAMEFVDGTSLVDMFAKGPMDPEDARTLLVRLASGLAVAHAAGIIHRDLSPDNIVLPGGKVERAKIIDFGIARSATVGGETLLGGSFAGKYNFVSPEQLGMAGGEVTERSDIYSLGLVIAAALRAKTINMTGSQVDIIEKRRVVPDLTGIDARMRPVIDAMLQPDPKNRPGSMTEIVEGLQRIPARQANIWEAEAPARMPEPTRAIDRDAVLQAPQEPPAGEAWPPVTSRTPMPWQSVVTPGASAAAGQTAQTPAASADAYGTTFPRGGATADSPRGGRSSGGPIMALVAVLAIAGVGGGAYFSGLLDGVLKPKTDAPAPQPLPETPPSKTPEPVPPKAEEPPQPAPEPTVPVTPETPPTTEQTEQPTPPPETGSQTDPDTPPAAPPVSDEVTEPTAPAGGGEQTEASPLPAADMLTQRRDWLKTYAGGDCFYAVALGASGDKLQIEGFGQTVQPFEAMLEAFKSAFGSDPEPDIGVRLIQAKQCPTTDFLRGLGKSASAAPDLTLEKDVLFNGDPMSGNVQLQQGKQTYLLLIDHDGIAHNLDGILKRSADKADFSVQLGLGTGQGVGKAPLPQILVAFSTSAVVEAMASTAAVPASDLLPRIVQEIKGRKIEAAASARYFRIRG